MNDLFEYSARQATRMSRPLAERMRPTRLADYMGQLDAVGEGRLVRRAIEQDKLFSMILWGPPGGGKTTLAKLMAAAKQPLQNSWQSKPAPTSFIFQQSFPA